MKSFGGLRIVLILIGWFAIAVIHVSDRLSRPHASKHISEKRSLRAYEFTTTKKYTHK